MQPSKPLEPAASRGDALHATAPPPVSAPAGPRPPREEAGAPSRGRPRLRRYLLPAVVAGALLAGAGVGTQTYRQWQVDRAFPEGLILANGRIEGDRVTVASKYPGRIAALLAREGDSVRAGAVVARIDDAQTRAQLQQAEAELRALMAQGSGAGENVALTRETTRAQVEQARGVLGQAESGVAAAQADAARAQAAVETAAANTRKAEAGVRTASAAYSSTVAAREGAREAVRVAEAALQAAQAEEQRAREGVEAAGAQVETARANVRALEAGVDAAGAAFEKASRDARRYRLLMSEGAIPQSTLDAMVAAEKTARAQLESARQQVAAAEKEVAARQSAAAAARQQVTGAQAQVNTRRAEISARTRDVEAAEGKVREAQAQVDAAQEELGAACGQAQQARAGERGAREAVRQMEARRRQAQGGLDQARTAPRQVAVSRTGSAQAQARIAQARARVRELRTVLRDLVVTAPVSGTVTTRTQDLGEVVATGAPVLELVNLDRLYLKVYVPEDEIGKLRLGLEGQVYTDAFPHQPFPARVGYVSSRAEFTPKEVQTRAERVKLVYAVRLYVDRNPDHQLTPGMPADAVIRWKEGTPWKEPRW